MDVGDGKYDGDSDLSAGDSAEDTGLERCSFGLLLSERSHPTPLDGLFLEKARTGGVDPVSWHVDISLDRGDPLERRPLGPDVEDATEPDSFEPSIHCTTGPMTEEGVRQRQKGLLGAWVIP